MSGRLLRAKVVMLGAPGVGKTSLVQRYVHSRFSEEYHSTLGVKVDRKSVELDETTVAMLVWDIHGEAEGIEVPSSYLRGATAALAVVDASRPETIAKAAELRGRLLEGSPGAVVYSVANKSDLDIDWDTVATEMSAAGLDDYERTSAKSGSGVEEIFTAMARQVAAN